MAHITTLYEVCGTTKSTNALNSTPLGNEILKRNNHINLSAKDKFIDAICNVKEDLIVSRDTNEEFMAYTKYGLVFNWYDNQYCMVLYPKPSRIPKAIIEKFIKFEENLKNYDNVAELYRFLSLTNEDKDKQGFVFYNWIWEENLVLNDIITKYF